VRGPFAGQNGLAIEARNDDDMAMDSAASGDGSGWFCSQRLAPFREQEIKNEYAICGTAPFCGDSACMIHDVGAFYLLFRGVLVVGCH
jgi:hypothetical protein